MAAGLAAVDRLIAISRERTRRRKETRVTVERNQPRDELCMAREETRNVCRGSKGRISRRPRQSASVKIPPCCAGLERYLWPLINGDHFSAGNDRT